MIEATRLAAAFVSAALLAVAAPAGAQRTLSDADVATYASVLRVADARVLDTVVIDAGLRSSALPVRVAAARALAQLAPTHRDGAIPRLRLLLSAPDAPVVAHGAFGLGLAHDSTAVTTLASIVRSTRDSTVARAAAWSLGEIGAPSAAEIDSLLASATLARTSARYVLLAASRLRAVPTLRIAPFLSARDTSVRWAAAYAIARPHRAGGASLLLALRSQPGGVRAEIARDLTAAATGDSLRSGALARLDALARDADPFVRIAAVRSLGTFGDAAAGAIRTALHDRDPQVRVAAAQGVARVFARDLAAWMSAWRTDTAYRYRRSLLESAAAAGVTLAPGADWIRSDDWRLRAAALGALASARDTPSALTVALGATRDRDPRVRGAVYGVLAALDSAGRDPRVHAAFEAARAEADTIARNAVPALHDTASPHAPAPQPLEWYEHVVRTVVRPALVRRAPTASITTERGTITVALYGADAPLTVWDFASLARRGFYDGLRFHRVVPAFVAQDGDPRGDGEGGPPYAIRDELTPLPYVRGAVGMALSGPDTGGSQYFLTLTPQPHLDGHYTIFGKVTAGAHAMDALREGDLIRSITIRNFDP